MWKASLLIFLILSGIISGMVLWQWQAYSERAIALESSEAITQEITVETHLKELKITQKLYGLVARKEYRLDIPDTLYKWNCKTGTGKACDSADESPYTFFSADDQMIFEYTVPINDKKKALLLTDWFVKIIGIKAESLSISISDSFKREGSWAAGIRLKAQKKLDHIDYYYFEGYGNVPSLYWQEEPLLKTAINNTDVYTAGTRAASLDFKKLNDIGDFPFMSIILTDRYPEYMDENILIASPYIKVDQLEKELIALQFQRKFADGSPDWIVDAFTAGLLDLKPGSAKGSIALKEFKGKLTEDELKNFLINVYQADSLNAGKLDKLLGNAKGLQTQFFTMNIKNEAPLVPLYFQEEKKLWVSGAEKASISLLYRDGKVFLPFTAAMQALGYEVKILSGEETMLVSKGNNSYRFYLNKNVFIYNEEDYGLLINPLTRQNGTVWMEIQWFKALFGVTAEEREGGIHLTP
ncbi:stalk domain-containing protein [Cytobacillus sp. FSL H8-0458]|uniref:stalk domain-containing protein n=1 Tax=Cytobacillus sp. FSL H8-0458 TaxID=2975346 RepID=UPI0030F5CA48